MDRQPEVAISYQIRMAAMAGHLRARPDKTRLLAFASGMHRNTVR
ncbi:MAG TPA: hypothetical protein VMU26_04800 [Candidatus Polarisedimenticolia bacterium]|nr:hypothetical protein [Candidatus Polarisedimenticolia bacterium]